jgi:hypothetical protein
MFCTKKGKLRVMMFNATFNNMSVISWRLVLLVEKMEVPEVFGENHWRVASQWQTLSHNLNVVSSTLRESHFFLLIYFETYVHWMSVKLPDNFQMREHSWPCRFHIKIKQDFHFTTLKRFKIIKLTNLCYKYINSDKCL